MYCIYMQVYELNLIGEEQLRSMYSIYIIVLKSEHGKYFYIGQTGDRAHITARSPFYRLSGHLGKQNRSTENQIYKGIMDKILKIKFDENTYEKVEDYFKKSQLTMYTFPIFDYQYNTTKEKHTEKRQNVEEIESKLINEFLKKYGINRILNKSNGIERFNGNNNQIEEIKKYIFEKEG